MFWIILYVLLGLLWAWIGTLVIYKPDNPDANYICPMITNAINTFIWPLGLLFQTFIFISKKDEVIDEFSSRREVTLSLYRLMKRHEN